MVDQEQVWKEIIETFSPGKIRELEKIIKVETYRKNPIAVMHDINQILEAGFGVELSSDFFIKLDSRTVRKYLQPLRWRRIKSKREAREEKIDPYTLAREARQKISLDRPYGGMGWRGLSDRLNKNFLLYSYMEGQELFDVGKSLIKINRWDLPSELKEVEKEERKRIAREISKLSSRKTNLVKSLMQRGGMRTGEIPSRSEIGKIYGKGNVRYESLPIKFMGVNSDFHFGIWFDITSRHTCADKQMFLTYTRPKEEMFCAHDIAFLKACHYYDYNSKTDPYLVFTPFPDINPILVEDNKRYRKQVFKNINGRKYSIGKIDREKLLFLDILAKDAKLF